MTLKTSDISPFPSASHTQSRYWLFASPSSSPPRRESKCPKTQLRESPFSCALCPYAPPPPTHTPAYHHPRFPPSAAAVGRETERERERERERGDEAVCTLSPASHQRMTRLTPPTRQSSSGSRRKQSTRRGSEKPSPRYESPTAVNTETAPASMFRYQL